MILTDLLPNGQPFLNWERTQSYSHTYHVAQNHPNASDANPGTSESPFLTIGAAARLVQAGERVLVHAGTYREAVRPPRGGEGPERMIGYEAALGETVVIRGSEVYTGSWNPAGNWGSRRNRDLPPAWEIALPEEWFVGVNPFGAVNLSRYDDGEELSANEHRLKDPMMRVYLMRRGLVFQDGRRLKQVFLREELADADGTYWVDRDGLDVTLRPFGDIHPTAATFELTARQHCFAPSARYLGYLRVTGFVMEHAGDGFPRPQGGLLSAMRGHHWIIENNTVRHANGCGMDLAAQSKYEPDNAPGDHVIRRNVVEYCGIAGICGTGQPSNLLVEDNLLRGNCWQNLGNLEEAAAIKFHVTRNALVRRNLILDTGDGVGNGAGIWMDWECRNSRVTANVILRTKTHYGAIFVEASRSKDINLVDHNIILDTVGHGIYAHNGDRLEIRHNLVARSSGAGVQLGWSDPNLWVNTDGEEARGATGRKNIVVGNLLAANRIQIEFDNPDNLADHNALGTPEKEGPGAFRMRRLGENLNLAAWREFHGLDTHSVRTEITLAETTNASGEPELAITVTDTLPTVPAEPKASVWGGSESARVAGPLEHLPPGAEARISLDPRQKTTL